MVANTRAPRRRAWQMLGVAGIAAIWQTPFAVQSRKRSSKKAKRKCRNQAAQCASFYVAGCDGDPVCLATGERCCPIAASCDVVRFITCVTEPVV